MVDADGNESAGFPWAEVGLDALHRHAADAGMVPRQSWTAEGRNFCELLA